jgi:hypothetical protein
MRQGHAALRGGGGCGGTWRRKGGLAGAPTQAQHRRAARRAVIGEGGVRHGWAAVVSRAGCWSMWKNGKMGPGQEAPCHFHNYSNKFQKNRIDLIRRGPFRALKISSKIWI